MAEADGDTAIFDARLPKIIGHSWQRIIADADRKINLKPRHRGGQVRMLASLLAGLG